MNQKETITNTIKTLGIPANLRGYHYVRYAIELLIADNSYIGAIMALYTDVADKFSTTVTAVERNIRHAIETGWERTNTDLINELFGETLDPNKEYPTNSEFITTIADYVSNQQEN
jgi:two-component system response regulator (stage 0 sporulation protein A)